MIKWKDDKIDICSSDVGLLKNILGENKLEQLLLVAPQCPVPIINKKILNDIDSHISLLNMEMGGLLLGRVYSTSDLSAGVVAIQVTKSFPSLKFKSSPVSLSMEPEVWSSANRESNNEEFVVGWYHSHPNLGAFFSGTDRHTQRQFFNKPYSLGLVLDPVRQEQKWYLGKESIEAFNVIMLCNL